MQEKKLNLINAYCKICDVRNLETAQLCSQLGADLIGLHAIRSIKPERLDEYRKIKENAMQLNLLLVLVTLQKTIEQIMIMIDQVQPDYIQLHSDIFPDSILTIRNRLENSMFGTKIIAVSNCTKIDLKRLKAVASLAHLILLDRTFYDNENKKNRPLSHDEIRSGIDVMGDTPFFIAGGLDSKNVIRLIREFSPYGVDVQTGVEYPDYPGVKDPARLRKFIDAVRKA